MLTIVSPWYGPDTRGGAETQARSLAQALHAQGVAVRVWASTGRDSFSPGDDQHYPPGDGELDGIPLWRFRPNASDERGVPHFFRQHPQLLPPLERFTIHELRLLGTLLSSDELYAAILRERAHSRFVFVPYPFPTSFWGSLIAPESSYLLPCLHDEPYARYSTYRYMFHQVRGVLANSHAEAELARQLYNLPAERVCVAGEGIDLTPRGDGDAFRQKLPFLTGDPSALLRAGRRRETRVDSLQYSVGSLQRNDHEVSTANPSTSLRAGCQLPTVSESPTPYLLFYAGRRDESKNIPLLVSYVREYWARRGTPLLLLLAGQGKPDFGFGIADFGLADNTIRNPKSKIQNVIDLGFLDEQTKHDAYAAADLFVQPSLHESFSIVLMEAWLQGTPALVHGDCAVTADHARRSGGGLAFRSFGEFAAALDLLLPRPELRQELGARGQAYVLDTCRWDEVARKTAAFVLGEG
ncbi:MAG: glycosyltransferase family 4 protein [Chloroflexaceae bacterium]|jgi:glycosyltransferase involved in cell wall biosynthesis|nr:glycosyltransferase family 4 protein [Chloroflexaceae bacterium]